MSMATFVVTWHAVFCRIIGGIARGPAGWITTSITKTSSDAQTEPPVCINKDVRYIKCFTSMPQRPLTSHFALQQKAKGYFERFVHAAYWKDDSPEPDPSWKDAARMNRRYPLGSLIHPLESFRLGIPPTADGPTLTAANAEADCDCDGQASDARYDLTVHGSVASSAGGGTRRRPREREREHEDPSPRNV